MRKQKVFLVACFIFSSASLMAQRVPLDQSFGLSGSGGRGIRGSSVQQTDSTLLTANYSLTLLQFGIVYFPRKDFISWPGGSFSIGSPLMFGASVTTSYQSTNYEAVSGKRDTISNLSGGHFAFSVPVVVDLNIGLHSAAAPSNQRIGIYAGAGYGYNFTRIKTSAGKINYDGFESLIRAGIRLGRIWENRFTIGVNVRGAFENSKTKTYELHLVKDL